LEILDLPTDSYRKSSFKRHPSVLPNRDRLATRQPESHLDDLRATVTAMIWKFADAAAQAGIDLDNLITILESGVPIQAVLDLIQVRRESRVANHNLGSPN
jgi:hypothetical protein